MQTHKDRDQAGGSLNRTIDNYINYTTSEMMLGEPELYRSIAD